jgi:predicted KAP-like P-loop ATPase
MKTKVTKVQEVQEVVKTGKELLADAIAALTPEQLALIYPPIQRANFVVRKSWMGRNQVITFINNKNQRVTYNHDEVLQVMLPKLSIMPCWIKREYWSQSTDMPANVRHLATIENLEATAE